MTIMEKGATKPKGSNPQKIKFKSFRLGEEPKIR
jgi:hypothetical protein